LGFALAAKARLAPGGGDSELTAVRKRHPGLIIQLMTVDDPPGLRAVSMIGLQTLRAAKSGALLATKPEVDLLLRLSGTSQIAVAIQRSGYKASGEKLLVAVGDPRRVGRLGRELAKDKRYEMLDDGEPSSRDLKLVERAALLGTRP
jgi:tRNA threonylcarbamoyladenosine modification (KEOPS) complex Cgi121 subunit